MASIESTPLREATVSAFGGLNVTADPQDIGWDGAVACSNLMLDRPGQLRTREGYAARATASAVPSRVYVFYRSSTIAGVGSSIQYIVSSATTSASSLQTFDSSGTSLGTFGLSITGTHTFVTFGTPTSSIVYAANRAGGSVKKWDGSTWGSINISGRALAITRSNRLLVAAATIPLGVTGDSVVAFSDAGAPETFGTANFVELTPGDGETIWNAVAWQDKVFAFKRSKFFVFTGEGLQSDGSPVFNYYAVNGVGTVDIISAACAAPDGVYFIAPDGIYRTTGGAPVKISAALDSLFGTSSSALTLTDCNLTWFRGLLIATLVGASGPTTYVWHRDSNTWTTWGMLSGKATGAFCGDPSSSNIAFVNGTDSQLFVLGPSWTTDNSAFASDNGSAIAWSYTSGYAAPADGRRVKLRGSSVWGYSTNAPTLQILTEGGRTNDVVDPGGTVTLGTSPTVAEGKRRRATRGVLFAHKLSGTGPATISRLTHRFLPPEPDA
jgi:hypothetical protein